MKKSCCIGLCLLLASDVVLSDWMAYEAYPDELVARIREEYKSPEKLKEALTALFVQEHLFFPEEISLFKQKFHISDEVLRIALMDIYKSVQHLGGDPYRPSDPEELTDDKRRLYNSIVWFGYCADEPAKRLLLDIASDDTKEWTNRIVAIHSYIQRADAQQVKDVLARALIGDMQVKPYSTYLSAMEAYDEAKDDALKREAIVSVLSIALAQESDKQSFIEMDKKLAERSKEYAKSSQRKAALGMAGQPEEPPVNKNILWLAVLAFAVTAGTVAWWQRKRK